MFIYKVECHTPEAYSDMLFSDGWTAFQHAYSGAKIHRDENMKHLGKAPVEVQTIGNPSGSNGYVFSVAGTPVYSVSRETVID